MFNIEFFDPDGDGMVYKEAPHFDSLNEAIEFAQDIVQSSKGFFRSACIYDSEGRMVKTVDYEAEDGEN